MKLKYNKKGRLIFTKQMKKEYTILAPQMLKNHFYLFKSLFEGEGYKIELIDSNSPKIIEEGLRNVHNDICYPALLVIGQLIDALKSGKYDINKVALLITQTGGGCRASNYIHLIRKALKNANMEFIPVVSLSIGNLEKNPGFKLTLSMIKKMNAVVMYGDLIMACQNYKRCHELNAGESDKITQEILIELSNEIKNRRPPKKNQVIKNFKMIVEKFDRILEKEDIIPKVGIVGEIYVKFAPLGNNNLEQFLHQENVEYVVPGLYNFIIFKIDVRIIDRQLYGGKFLHKLVYKILLKKLLKWQERMNKIINESKTLPKQSNYNHLKELAKPYAGAGNKMGEGWLLVAEMLELIEMNVGNIVCTQPFGCLPNHIIGKGVIKKIHENHLDSNIVPIDYDPGASRVNQENRIKLMLAASRRILEKNKQK